MIAPAPNAGSRLGVRAWAEKTEVPPSAARTTAAAATESAYCAVLNSVRSAGLWRSRSDTIVPTAIAPSANGAPPTRIKAIAKVDEVVISPSDPSCITRIGRHSPAISATAKSETTGSGRDSSARPSHSPSASTATPTTDTKMR